MVSLQTLREHILERLGLDPENVTALVRQGTVRSHYNRDKSGNPDGHRDEYTAIVYLDNYTLAPELASYVIAEWRDAHHPGHDGLITFDLDIIDHNTVDLSYAIPGIVDRYIAIDDGQGARLAHKPNPAADPIVRPSGLVSLRPQRATP